MVFTMACASGGDLMVTIILCIYIYMSKIRYIYIYVCNIYIYIYVCIIYIYIHTNNYMCIQVMYDIHTCWRERERTQTRDTILDCRWICFSFFPKRVVWPH